MKPLIVLITAFLATLGISWFIDHEWHWSFSGKLAMAIMLCFTALGHFMFTKGMTMMLPPSLPFRKEAVLITGVLEPLMGIALLVPAFEPYAAWILILFFVFMLPANIYAAIKGVDYQKADYNGAGKSYLWFRIPLQLLFIVWVWLFALVRIFPL